MVRMNNGNLLAAEIVDLIQESKNPEETLGLIEDTIKKYLRGEVFWRTPV